MKNGLPEPRKSSRLPRWVRMLLYLPVVVVILFFVLRRLEFMATYHPEPYVPGPNWALPANGEEVWVKVATGERVHGWFLREGTACDCDRAPLPRQRGQFVQRRLGRAGVDEARIRHDDLRLPGLRAQRGPPDGRMGALCRRRGLLRSPRA